MKKVEKDSHTQNLVDVIGTARQDLRNNECRGVLVLVFRKDGNALEYSNLPGISATEIAGVLETMKFQKILNAVVKQKALNDKREAPVGPSVQKDE